MSGLRAMACAWLARKALRVVAPRIDYSLRAGDWVVSDGWPHGPLQIVDVNWDVRAVAVDLAPGRAPERDRRTERMTGIMVWPVWSVRRQP